ncbi:MAG TPA: DUF3592 domain-containing protein, partial [Blastocatellia bacterium]|nr:DUF3592 domain-containing protein [Blastocatellia bacterium]
MGNHHFARVLLLDQGDQPFLAGASKWTAAEKKIAKRIVWLALFLVAVGLILYFQRRDSLRAALELIGKGGRAQGLILEKHTSEQGEGVDFYYVTYRFRAPAGKQTSAITRSFTTTVMVSQAVFNRTAVGEAAVVWYDRTDPSVSILDASAQNPVISGCLVVGWWAVSLVVLGYHVILCLGERALASKGSLIQGCVSELSESW